jgi:hypothetical protein
MLKPKWEWLGHMKIIPENNTLNLLYSYNLHDKRCNAHSVSG